MLQRFNMIYIYIYTARNKPCSLVDFGGNTTTSSKSCVGREACAKGESSRYAVPNLGPETIDTRSAPKSPLVSEAFLYENCLSPLSL